VHFSELPVVHLTQLPLGRNLTLMLFAVDTGNDVGDSDRVRETGGRLVPYCNMIARIHSHHHRFQTTPQVESTSSAYNTRHTLRLLRQMV
jgi:hypothetical protein